MLSYQRFARLAAVTLIALAAFPPSARGQTGGAQPQRARPAPATQRSADSVHSIATGSRHTCALMGSGAVYCWGHDIGRYDGSRSARAIARPTRVTPAPPFTTITAFAEHVCGLTASGEAWCWGANEWGQAGNGPGVEATGRAPTRGAYGAQATPFRVRGDHVFRSLATGGSISCGIDAGSRARCWGFSTFGALGAFDLSRPDHTGGDNPIPLAVHGDREYSAIFGGSSHTCALTSEGRAWCWGADGDGQTGRERANLKHQPGEVSGDVRFAALAPGGRFTCGLGLDASAWCWGTGARFGQQQWVLGTGVENSLVPVRVEVPGRLVAVAANSGHACALTEAGEAWCWGANTHGQLGQGTITLAAPPAAVQTELRFRQLDVGAMHTCGLTTTGRVACWGDDQFRQVGGATPNCPGQGTLRCFITPVVLPPLPPAPPRAPR